MTNRPLVSGWSGWLLLASVAAAQAPSTGSGQNLTPGVAILTQSTPQLRDWDVRIDRMVRSGELRVRQRRDDALIEGRVHERADQYHRGVRVFGADVARQFQNGQLVSVFGTFYPEIDADTTPRPDSDNEWTDGAIDDAHVYSGWTYDYYFKRFNRRGLDNADIPIVTLVHPIRRIDFFDLFDELQDLFVNAFYAGDGVMVYGVGAPPEVTFGGQTWDFLSGALDIVTHELTHGVTEYTSNLIYRNESGALNESFSDMMATGAEFFQSAGSGPMQADYSLGEDVIRPGGVRSMANPRLSGDPDHYSQRFTGTADNGGVHINSGIPNQAFYLAIEGGTNRTSGHSVQGVGAANREQIEKVFYRAFTQLLPANATFAVARAATIQSARDLYGASSAAERAVAQAWSAVGVE